MLAELILAMVFGAGPYVGSCMVGEPAAVVVSNRLVGRSVLCYYQNVGVVRTKEYVAVRVRIGERTGRVNVPVVNGHLPTIQWQLDINGIIESMICNYEGQIKYEGKPVSYGEEPVKAKAKLSCTPSPDPIQVSKVKAAPVPSKATIPIPRVGELLRTKEIGITSIPEHQ